MFLLLLASLLLLYIVPFDVAALDVPAVSATSIDLAIADVIAALCFP